MKGRPDPIDLHAGQRIRAMRIAAGVTQEQLAVHLDLTFQQIQKYERGVNRVSASALYRIAQRLGQAPGFVFEGLAALPQDRSVRSRMDDFAVEPGAFALADLFLRLSRQRQSAVVAVARALLEETQAALTGRSGARGMVPDQLGTLECRSPPPPTVRSPHRPPP